MKRWQLRPASLQWNNKEPLQASPCVGTVFLGSREHVKLSAHGFLRNSQDSLEELHAAASATHTHFQQSLFFCILCTKITRIHNGLFDRGRAVELIDSKTVFNQLWIIDLLNFSHSCFLWLMSYWIVHMNPGFSHSITMTVNAGLKRISAVYWLQLMVL